MSNQQRTIIVTVIEWFGWEGTLETIQFWPLCCGRGPVSEDQVIKVPSNASRDEQQYIPLAFENELDTDDRYFILECCDNKWFSRLHGSACSPLAFGTSVITEHQSS